MKTVGGEVVSSMKDPTRGEGVWHGGGAQLGWRRRLQGCMAIWEVVGLERWRRTRRADGLGCLGAQGGLAVWLVEGRRRKHIKQRGDSLTLEWMNKGSNHSKP